MSAHRRDRIELFTAGSWIHVDQRPVWYWSYISGNGRILADGGQGYSKRIDALHGARRVTGLDLADECDFVQAIDIQARQVWMVAR